MGAGIAQLVLQAGYGASVMEVEQGLLDKGVARIKGGFQRLVEKGALAGDKAAGFLAGLQRIVQRLADALCPFPRPIHFNSIGLSQTINPRSIVKTILHNTMRGIAPSALVVSLFQMVSRMFYGCTRQKQSQHESNNDATHDEYYITREAH